MIMVAPAGLENMFLEAGAPASRWIDNCLPPTQEEITKLLKIPPKYGVEILLPHP